MTDHLQGDTVGFILNRTNSKLKNTFYQNLSIFNLTPEQFGLINTLYNHPGISQKELAEKSYKDQPTITRMLDILEKKHLIIRQSHPNDRRTTLLHLSDEGKILRNQLVPIAEKTLEGALQGFSDNEIEQLKLLLNRIFSNLD